MFLKHSPFCFQSHTEMFPLTEANSPQLPVAQEQNLCQQLPAIEAHGFRLMARVFAAIIAAVSAIISAILLLRSSVAQVYLAIRAMLHPGGFLTHCSHPSAEPIPFLQQLHTKTWEGLLPRGIKPLSCHTSALPSRRSHSQHHLRHLSPSLPLIPLTG